MKRLIHICIVLIGTITLLHSCKKDKLDVIGNNPLPYDSIATPYIDSLFYMPPPGPFGWMYEIPRNYQYFAPCFNPRSANQFVYVAQNRGKSLGTCELRIFDLSTGTNKLLCANSYIGGNPNWSVNGWIVFTGDDEQIWKIKEDGSGLSKLTDDNYFNDRCIFSNSGDKILFRKDGNEFKYIVSTDDSGNVIDTFPDLVGKKCCSWTIDDKLVIITQQSDLYHGVGYYSFSSKSIKQIEGHNLTDSNAVGLITKSVYWFNHNSEMIWQTGWRIAKSDTLTGTTSLIRRGSENAVFQHMTISHDEKHIIFSREDYTPTSGYFATLENNIYIMDADGTNLRKIILDR